MFISYCIFLPVQIVSQFLSILPKQNGSEGSHNDRKVSMIYCGIVYIYQMVLILAKQQWKHFVSGLQPEGRV